MLDRLWPERVRRERSAKREYAGKCFNLCVRAVLCCVLQVTEGSRSHGHQHAAVKMMSRGRNVAAVKTVLMNDVVTSVRIEKSVFTREKDHSRRRDEEDAK